MESKIKQLKDSFSLNGFEDFPVNLFEEFEHYYINREYITTDKVLKVMSEGNVMMAMQADITISAAKVFSSKRDKVNASMKICYEGETFSKAKQPNPGIRKQHVLGIESFGVSDCFSDLEVLSLALETLAIWERKFLLVISFSDFLDNLLSQLPLLEQEKATLTQAIQMKNVTAINSQLDLYKDNPLAQLISTICTQFGTLLQMYELLVTSSIAKYDQNILPNLKTLLTFFEKKPNLDKIQVDFSLKNEQSYYQGIIFQGFIEGINNPILLGGRSNLLKTKEEIIINSVGFSLALDDLTFSEDGRKQQIDCLIIYQESNAELHRLIETLHKQNKSTYTIKATAITDVRAIIKTQKYHTVYQQDKGIFTKEEY
ncbi:MAG: ATP phosphoribosyltransferase regulatory subunit [Culicoidibacterales bacterium]